MGKHLILGSSGHLGVELMLGLQERYGANAVVLSDLRPSPHPAAAKSSFVAADATDFDAQRAIVENHDVEVIYNLVAILSAQGEANPMAAWGLNMNPLLNTLELARKGAVKRVFWPSSIAVFGSDVPKDGTPQDASLVPTTVYGVSKAAGELWCNYYYEKYGVDARSIRYPGLIGFRSMPGGGTTDYAVSAFHCAMAGETLTCYLEPNERLPMMSMEDAVRGTLDLMETPEERIRIRTAYNLSGCDFTPEELTLAMKGCVPGFEIVYAPDERQDIAASWPNSLDDSWARNDWDWTPRHDLRGLVEHIIDGLAKQSNVDKPTLNV